MKTIIARILSYAELKKKYNALQVEHEILEALVKEDVVDKLFSNADKEIKLVKLEKENRNLRKKVKTLKEILKNGE